ncbi:MAG TPA: hypothetical protein VH592_03785 [Gemmataceae bacterium]|jgi:hypothetical protein
MWDSVKRLSVGVVGVATLFALGRPAAISQQPTPAPAANQNVYVNPFASTGRAPSAPASGRLGYGSLTPNGGAASGSGSGLGYGTLAASYANPSTGYGSLSNSNNNNPYSNPYGPYGYGGFGTQWMMNPYQGYLSGAADLTRANAEYYQTISQAKLLRQEAIRSSIQTRRAMIEEAEWEREHMPDPEKIRQQALERELNRARSTPPLQDIWNATALNALLRYLIAQQGQGMKGPDAPLSEETLDHINLTVGGTRANVGLLKNNADLQWPLSMQRELFKPQREKINELMRESYRNASKGTKPDSSTISDLRHNYDKLRTTLQSNIDQLTPDEFIEANRYLSDVGKAIDALKSASVVRYLDGTWKSKARNVAELVDFMSKQGLWFAAATPKDEAAYVSLYYSLASFDRGMQRAAREVNGESER